MGFRLNRTYALRWDEGTDLAGLEVDMRSTSLQELTEVAELLGTLSGADFVAAHRELCGRFAAHVVRWNLEDEGGKALPVTAESLLGQEMPLVASLVLEWMRAAKGVSAPLVLRSTPTGTEAPEELDSIPMATL